MSKKSIRFFNDREVRAVWDEENTKWWFSITDIVRPLIELQFLLFAKMENLKQ